ncbi:hypothetical protein ASG43_12070 [Aureimonas sp. Leaf454]|uniref:SIS domain-containing protein n=1 Tax=Aureimonas sp. Leaf454 TaxID=1736381 RepID=UPI0006F53290|nr:hypothetical protein [Aureimonas sp. Leaf454]KQT46351.1 hypothetical protein ASG43_12070 [Aureimonas sp. Leaf454]
MPTPSSAAPVQPDGKGAPGPDVMLQDIRRQPRVLSSILDRREEIARFAADHLDPRASGRLHAFGSGDGWFAARAAFHGTGAVATSGLDFLLNVAPTLGPDDRAVAISMSGNVDRTLEGAEAALARGAGLSVLTNGEGGRLGALGGPRLSLDIADLAPFLCGTSSYTATAAVLGFLARREDHLTRATTDALPSFIEEADRVCREVASATAGPRAEEGGEEGGASVPGIRFLGVGQSLAAADYGAAKCVEVTTIPAWSDDIEEFAHRQYWSMKRGEIVVLLPVDAASAPYADATADALGRLGTPTLAIGPAEAATSRARHRITTPGTKAEAWLGQAVALQLLSYRLGIANGTDPNRRLHLKNDVERFAVSRRLTRLSLLGTGA